MKILFVVREIEYINPMGAQLLSALAKSGGRAHRTALHSLAPGRLPQALEEFRPDLVAYAGAKTGEHRFYLEAAARIERRFPEIFQIMGGPHPTYFPHEIERSALDAICVGEGEDAWLELLDALEAGGSIQRIPNILTKENYPAWRSDPGFLRPRRSDLDSLPFLDWDLALEGTRLGAFPMRSFMVSRGCPFRCGYCFEHQDNELYRGKGPILRRMSVRRVCDELSALKRAYPNTQRIKEYSDVFPVFPGVDDAWCEEFAEEYPKRVGLPFHTLVRADLIAKDPRKAHLLKKAGCDSVTMSIETGNEELRNRPDLMDRGMSNRDMEFSFELFRSLGVATFANCIFGMPVPSDVLARDAKKPIDYDIETLDLCVKLRPSYVETGVFYPYPGTRLAAVAERCGYFDGDFDRLHNNYSFLSPLTCLTPEEKWRQLRLCFLSTVVCLFPRLPRVTRRLRDFFVERLSRWPATGLCYWMYYLSKVYLTRYYIYPMRLSWADIARNLWFSARLEWFKRMTDSAAEPEDLPASPQDAGPGPEKLSIAVAAFNEERNLRPAVEAILRAFGRLGIGFEVLVFDDASRDGTGRVADELAKEHPGVRTFHNPRNLNIGGVYKEGLRRARGEYYLLLPGDNEVEVEEVADAARLLGSAAPTRGSAAPTRGSADAVLTYTKNPEVRPLGRRLLSRAYVWIVNALFGTRFRYTNGSNIIRTELARSVPIRTNGFSYQTELLVKLAARGASFVEHGIRIRPRDHGRSSALSLRNWARVAGALARTWWEMRSGSFRRFTNGRKIRFIPPTAG